MLANSWIPAAVRKTHVARTLQAGETLFREGRRTTGFYEVVRGKVRLVRVAATGREAVLYVAGAGETLAEASLFARNYHCDAIATTKAVVRLYPKAAVLAARAGRRRGASIHADARAAGDEPADALAAARDIRSARDRVRLYMAVNVGPDRRTVVLPGTVKELAGELGLTHESLYRTLAAMATDGEIERHQGKIRASAAVV